MKPPIDSRTNEPVRECIAAFGPPKVGKSTGWKAIAQWHKTASDPVTMYVINTDGYAAKKLLMNSDLDNVVVYDAHNWEQFRDAQKNVMLKAQQGDWVVVDLVDRCWRYVQNYYAQTVYGAGSEFDEAEYLLAKRAQWQGETGGVKKQGDPGPQKAIAEGWDWGYINQLYDSRVLPLILETPAHVYVVTEATDLNKNVEMDKMKRMMFDELGIKMTGQKSLPYQVDTMLFIETLGGKRVLSNTPGDRERQIIRQVDMPDLVQGYLLPYAGWTL